MQNKISKFLIGLVTVLAVLLFASLLILLFLQVTLRYGFNAGFSWIEDYSVFCFIWISLLGVALGVSRKSHIAVDSIISLLPAKIRYYSNILNTVLCIAFYGCLFYSGVQFTKLGFVMKSPVLRLPYSVMYIAIPIVCGICIILLALQLLSTLKEKEDSK